MKKIITDILISFGILILALLACIAMNSFAIERTYVAMVLVLAVFLISVVTDGFVYGVVASGFRQCEKASGEYGQYPPQAGHPAGT